MTRDFELTDADFEAFKAFTNDKDYNYNTDTEEALKRFKEQAEKENYLNDLKTEFESLNEKLKGNKNNDLNKYKSEIMQVLEEEIAARYYYEKARIEASFDNDADINEALKLFSDLDKYKRILAGK
jgi:carboxyl-terminal processing protease